MNGGSSRPSRAGQRYGKMLEIALVSAENLRGIVNEAFTMKKALTVR
jgi:hypothetical protein